MTLRSNQRVVSSMPSSEPEQVSVDTLAQRWHDQVCQAKRCDPKTHARIFRPCARSVLALVDPARQALRLHEALCGDDVRREVRDRAAGCSEPREHGRRLVTSLLAPERP